MITTLQGRGYSSDEILALVTATSDRLGQSLPSDLEARLEAASYAETGRQTIVEVEPDSSGFELSGTIMSADSVNFFKRIGYPDNQISRGFLGSIAREPFLELRIRGAADPVYGIVAEVTCFVAQNLYDKRGLRIGKTAHVRLVAHKLPSSQLVWVAEE